MVRGVLAGTPVEEFVDAAALARLVVEGAVRALVQVAEVVSVVQGWDPAARRAPWGEGEPRGARAGPGRPAPAFLCAVRG
ncbi:hypothetical protein [Nocardiopsis flavescens]|uniref:hypothetical protein n=1 Tax=Nocardiopsis flavescens TaxID=758803 RepID=UPI0015B8AB78|nr:hypothetical protein [Nocardiopsis flavescens]